MILIAYKFSNFTLDVHKETLRCGDESIKLNARAFQVLKLLVENAENTVTKDAFFEQVWAGTIVEENNLTVAVTQIRKALGETKENKFIETVPRKGYRFVKEVEKVFEKTAEENKSEPFIIEENHIVEELPEQTLIEREKSFYAPKKGFWAILATRKYLALIALAIVIFTIGAFWRQGFWAKKSEPFQSIAVLPFSTDKNTPDNEVFAEKLTQELIYNLGRITDTRLSGYEAVALYSSPEIDLQKAGNDLQIDGAITGSIKNTGEMSELEVRINDLRTGEIIFTNRYSLKPQDLADSQYRIANDIARELGKTDKQPNQKNTTSLEAYQAYLLARNYLTKRSSKDYENAVEHFTQATLKDASFADAYSGLATAHVLHGLSLYANRGLSASRKSFPAAKDSALKALELKKDSDEAFAALAFVNYRHEYDWTNAETNFRKALEINPNNVSARRWFGEFLHCAGRFDEGFAEQQKALALEPNSARILSEIAWGNYLAHRFDEAENYAKKANYIDKSNAATLYNLSEIYEQKGNLEEAVLLWKEAMMIEAAARRWIAEIEKSFQKDGRQGFAKAKAAWLEDLIEKDYVYPTDLAKCYAVLGEKDKAIEWLEKGIEARVPDILSIKNAPAFDSLKADARFQAILVKMNFPK